MFDETEPEALIGFASARGINFFDVVNSYSGGSSEQIGGRVLRKLRKRDESVPAAKWVFPMVRSAQCRLAALHSDRSGDDDSLNGFGIGLCPDVYQIHDGSYATPIGQTLEALSDVVRVGNARYIGEQVVGVEAVGTARGS